MGLRRPRPQLLSTMTHARLPLAIRVESGVTVPCDVLHDSSQPSAANDGLSARRCGRG